MSSHPSDFEHTTKPSPSKIPVKYIKLPPKSSWTLTIRYHQLGVSDAGPPFQRTRSDWSSPGFKNRDEVGEVIVEIEKDAERWSLDNRPCSGWRADRGWPTRCMVGVTRPSLLTVLSEADTPDTFRIQSPSLSNRIAESRDLYFFGKRVMGFADAKECC